MAARPFSPDSRVFVAGHRGLVGAGLVRNLKSKGFSNLVLKTRQELDLLDQHAVAHLTPGQGLFGAPALDEDGELDRKSVV